MARVGGIWLTIASIDAVGVLGQILPSTIQASLPTLVSLFLDIELVLLAHIIEP